MIIYLLTGKYLCTNQIFKTMKKILVLALLLSICLSAFSQKKVAVITYRLDKTIGSGNLGENAAFLKDVLTLAEDPNFDLQPVLDDFHDNFVNELAKDFPFELLPSEEVVNDPAYKSYVNDADTAGQFYILPEGYKVMYRPVLGMGQRDKKAMIEAFKDKADGIMFALIGFEFNKTTMMGVGVAKIKAIYNLVCYNMDGKKVFDIYRDASSKKSVPVAAGFPIMKLEKIQPLCTSAADELMKDVKKKLPKMARKAGKKL